MVVVKITCDREDRSFMSVLANGVPTYQKHIMSEMQARHHDLLFLFPMDMSLSISSAFLTTNDERSLT